MRTTKEIGEEQSQLRARMSDLEREYEAARKAERDESIALALDNLPERVRQGEATVDDNGPSYSSKQDGDVAVHYKVWKVTFRDGTKVEVAVPYMRNPMVKSG